MRRENISFLTCFRKCISVPCIVLEFSALDMFHVAIWGLQFTQSKLLIEEQVQHCGFKKVNLY